MRLTLRTLLAYIDEQLSEIDAEELGGRVERSEHAQDLKKRICLLATRRNVPAPPLLARGVGELNEVANYLDSAMPTDKVADFERACLESDIHLSEVGSVHNILARLRPDEEVTPELRRRLYLLNKFPVDSTISEDEANIEQHGAITERFVDSSEEKIVPGRDIFELSPPADFDHATAKDSPSDDVTEMRNAVSPPKVKMRVIPILAAIASCLLLTFLVLFATQSPRNEAAQSDSGSEVSDSEPDLKEALKFPKTATLDDDGKSNVATSNDATSEEDVATEIESVSEPENESDSPPPSFDVAPPNVPNENAVANSGNASPAVPPSFKVDEAKEEVDEARVKEDEAKLELASKLAFFGLASSELAKKPGRAVANIKTPGELLGTLDSNTGDWRAINAGESLKEGQSLIAFPIFRAELEFNLVAATTCGGGVFEILPIAEDGVPGINVQNGRFVFRNRTAKFVEISIVAGELSGVLTLQSLDSIVAIEVTRELPAGTDPLSFEAARRAVTRIQVTGVSGRSMWNEGGEVIQLDEKLSRSVDSGTLGVTAAVDVLPSWIDASFPTSIAASDRNTARSLLTESADIAPSFTRILGDKDRPPSIQSRILGQLCLLQLGDASQLMNILDSSERAYINMPLWQEAIRTARETVTRGPSTAAKFKQSIEEADVDGGKMFMLIRSFSNSQLAAGADAQLVAALDHDRQAIRVAAHQTLYAITGQSMLYRPEVDKRSRARNLPRWQQALKDEMIRYAETASE